MRPMPGIVVALARHIVPAAGVAGAFDRPQAARAEDARALGARPLAPVRSCVRQGAGAWTVA